MRATAVLALLASACATLPSALQGRILMKIDGTEAHIRMPDNTVALGDRVRFLRQQCTGVGKITRCRDESTGEGEIVQVLNARYSVVRIRCGVLFDEGDIVEKLGSRVPEDVMSEGRLASR